MFKKSKSYLLLINSIVIIALLLIHFVFRESNYIFSLLFYIFPLPIIIGLVILFSAFLRKNKKRYHLILALILSIVWIGRSFKINSADNITETDVEIVFWNATHKREFRHVFDEVETLPDVVVLVEYHAEELAQIKAKYPDYFFYWHSESEIGIFSRTPIILKAVFVSDDESKVICFTTSEIDFYAVDVSSSLHISRKQQLKFVSESINTNEKTVVLGDFNLPYESKFLKEIKTNFNHAFNEKGNGFRETWFWNIPLLSLDHIWVSKDLEILNAKKISTFKSDHSMVKAVIKN